MRKGLRPNRVFHRQPFARLPLAGRAAQRLKPLLLGIRHYQAEAQQTIVLFEVQLLLLATPLVSFTHEAGIYQLFRVPQEEAIRSLRAEEYAIKDLPLGEGPRMNARLKERIS